MQMAGCTLEMWAILMTTVMCTSWKESRSSSNTKDFRYQRKQESEGLNIVPGSGFIF